MSVALEADSCRDEVFLRQFPIHRACRDGDLHGLISQMERLSNRAHLTAEDSCYGWTPIHWAAHYGQLKCVVHLVQMGCEVNTVSSRFNQTPTHTAAIGGHSHCVVWLTQAGADINRQDCVGETPIHKAARSGSLECIQVLLIAGAEPHLRNSSGQTAADLAHAHGFHDCFCFISNTPTDLQQQLRGLQVRPVQNGDASTPCGRGMLCRKRQMPVREAFHVKKARRAEASVQQVAQEEDENMNMDLSPGGSAASFTSYSPSDDSTKPLPPLTSDLDHSKPSGPSHPADMCGSLHLSSSPGSAGSRCSESWRLMGEDCRDFLLYGHYHGFGDTAEDLNDSDGFSFRQPVNGSVHLYHGS
ncbi:ankyrin repeat domain-containing protein 10-like isoform X2 [Kryptolebias marmoratus]|uniref:ankyrin repeat domain-containing protein 10-like isoform X2 n=1 Tax=Kryptolebias marmoratus TaxID=37003 RepID=UPI0007F8D6CC|nr:ankyrin repeat domain-containing protein 10-like isoform X2 [Kryptolebias marmoratus]